MKQILSEMKENDKETKISNVIKKIINLHKPEGVNDIEFDLEQIDKDEYYLELIFVVPSDSDELKIKHGASNKRRWVDGIKGAIENYLGVKIIVSSVGVKSSGFNFRR